MSDQLTGPRLEEANVVAVRLYLRVFVRVREKGVKGPVWSRVVISGPQLTDTGQGSVFSPSPPIPSPLLGGLAVQKLSDQRVTRGFIRTLRRTGLPSRLLILFLTVETRAIRHRHA